MTDGIIVNKLWRANAIPRIQANRFGIQYDTNLPPTTHSVGLEFMYFEDAVCRDSFSTDKRVQSETTTHSRDVAVLSYYFLATELEGSKERV